MLSIEIFVNTVRTKGKELYRDFAWRHTSDPYAVLVSEVMLQQTQTARVEPYFERWMAQFPTIDALAAASTADVLEAWQGLGYNRRALALKRSAEHVSENCGGILPATLEELCALPGIGPATAAGVLAFAHEQHAVYLETNVRTVLLHEFFPHEEGISDKELHALLEQINIQLDAQGMSARDWNYALLDYGAYLKKTTPNPSRRSKHHSTQSPYEGSRRQKRARLLETILANPGLSTDTLAEQLAYDPELTQSILADLASEGFIAELNSNWKIS